MKKETIKLFGLLLLLIVSFIYTDKVVNEAKQLDPVMKKIEDFKKENDISSIEPIITEDEIILGYSGLVVNKNKSYKNMKKINKFDKNKIVFEKKLPENTIAKNYNYYIKKGNSKNKNISIIFKVKDEDNIDEILKLIKKNNVNITFFIDGKWLEKNVTSAFEINDLNLEIYNLGYEGKYTKYNLKLTNNLIESITLKDSLYCINEEKNNDYKNICEDKKMLTIKSTLLNPIISELKENLEEGIIISYDLNTFNYNNFNFIINTIESRGYEIVKLNKLLEE